MAGDNDQQVRAGRGVRHQGFLARVGAGRQQHPPIADLALQRGEGGRIVGQRLGQALEVELTRDVGAVRLDPGAGFQVLGVDQVVEAQQRTGGGRGAGPAGRALGGDAGAHQGQLATPLMGRLQQVRPELALHENAKVGAPVVQEAAHRARRIHRRVLVDHPLRQSAGQEFGGGAGARGDQELHVRPRGLEAGHQRQVRQALADADRVDPGQRAPGPGRRSAPEPLAETGRILLATVRSPTQQPGRQGLGQGHAGAIEAQG